MIVIIRKEKYKSLNQFSSIITAFQSSSFRNISPSMHTLHNNIWKLRVIRTCSSCMFFTPVIVLFWQSHWLTMTDIMLLQSCYAIGAMFFELPTWYLADRFTRKMSIILSCLFLIVWFTLYGFMTSFTGFLIGELILSLGIAFLWWAESALLYESLKALGREWEHTRIYWKNELFSYLGLTFASVMGWVLAPHIGYAQVLFLGIPFFVVALITAISLHEPSQETVLEKHEISSIEWIILLIRTHFRFSWTLVWLILISGITYALYQSILWIYQPYFTDIGIRVEYFGVIMASFQITAGIASHFAHRIELRFPRNNIFIFSNVLLALSYLGMILSPSVLSVWFCFMQQTVRGFLKPIVTTRLNEVVPSQFRATLLSVKWLSDRLFYAMMIPWLGIVADTFWLMASIMTLAWGAGVFALILLVQRVTFRR